LISIALNRGVRTQRLIEKMAVFGVSILGADQAAISDRLPESFPRRKIVLPEKAGSAWSVPHRC
jgi:flavin reductase (DIM6/NTAB) family NADH-FMN oxidoreductase RutF